MAAMTLEQAGRMPPPDSHFRVICLESGQVAETDSGDGDGHQALISCPPETGCCQEDHGHTPDCHQLIIHAKAVLIGKDS